MHTDIHTRLCICICVRVCLLACVHACLSGVYFFNNGDGKLFFQNVFYFFFFFSSDMTDENLKQNMSVMCGSHQNMMHHNFVRDLGIPSKTLDDMRANLTLPLIKNEPLHHHQFPLCAPPPPPIETHHLHHPVPPV